MAKKMHFDESGDSDDLQALFDNIAAQQPLRPKLEVVADAAVTGDNDDLQSLFDDVAGEYRRTQEAGAPAAAVGDTASAADANDTTGADPVFQRIGQITRQLHDMLRQLGLDRKLEQTARAIPDARQRLNYIAQMTEQAASRVLNATDVARPIQDALQAESEQLHARWERVFRNEMDRDDFRVLAQDTRGYLAGVGQKTRATNAQLTEIMMAQDFQDLTGQVIKKVVDMAHSMETELVHLLVEAMPDAMRPQVSEGLLNGPVTDTTGRQDVVTSQTQVDDLLESLGF